MGTPEQKDVSREKSDKWCIERQVLTLGRTCKFIPPPWYRGGGEGGRGWMEPLPGVFDMLQYFETILPLVESL